MTEKEFLKQFADTLQERDLHLEHELNAKIDKFLEDHHKSYVPVNRWIAIGEAVWTCEHGITHAESDGEVVDSKEAVMRIKKWQEAQKK